MERLLVWVLGRMKECGLDSYGSGQGSVTVPCENCN